MLRVIIADDEERICKLIRALADWQQLGMEVVGVASNGLDALECVKNLSPDILITDIRMPGLGGLELIEKAKQAVAHLEIIIISGYAQFDYAQTAIKYGVGEYLLKPVNEEALNSTLAKMGEKCLRRRRSERDMESLISLSQDDRSRLRENLISDLAEERYAACTQEEMDKVYHFSGMQDICQVFLLKMDYDLEEFTQQSLEIVQAKAEDIFRPTLEPLCEDIVLGFRGPWMQGVINYAKARRDDVRGRLREALNQLVALKSLFGPVIFTMALGQETETPAGLKDSYANARRVIEERLTEGTERLLEGENAAPQLDEAAFLARYAKEATHAIEVLNALEADSAAQSLYNAVIGGQSTAGWELLSLVKGAGVVFITRLGVENREQELNVFYTQLEQCTGVRELFVCLEGFQQTLIKKVLEKQRNQLGQPIRFAKQYIQKHFSQPITLEEVSDATGFSVNYFSTLFKKETGEGFSKYLTRVRMEEARSLLRETRLSVAEICKQVGYVDIKHFTHTFKAATGLTPGEFRKLYS